MRRAARGLGATLLAVLVLAGCRTALVQNVVAPVAGVPDSRLTMNEVARAIARAGNRLGWVIETVSPGALTGTLRLRQHVAVVSITHDTSTFRITYKDSTNLRYDGREIHKRYNHWVRNLEQAIRRELVDLPKS